MGSGKGTIPREVLEKSEETLKKLKNDIEGIDKKLKKDEKEMGVDAVVERLRADKLREHVKDIQAGKRLQPKTVIQEAFEEYEKNLPPGITIEKAPPNTPRAGKNKRGMMFD